MTLRIGNRNGGFDLPEGQQKILDPKQLKQALLRLYKLAILLSISVLFLVVILVNARFAIWKYWLGPLPDRHFEDVDRGVFFHYFAHFFFELLFTLSPFAIAICLLLKTKDDPARLARFAMHCQFQLTICFVTLVMILIGNVFFRRTLFSPYQLFWSNVVIGLASLVAYARERFDAADYALLRMRFVLRGALCHAAYQIAILVVLLLFADKFVPMILSARDPVYSRLPTRHITLLYCTFELMTLFNMANCRMIGAKGRNIFKGFDANRLFFNVWIGLFLLHLIGLLLLFYILPYLYGQESLIRFFFFSKPLTILQWLCCLALGASVLLWGQIIFCFTTKSSSSTSVKNVEGK